MRGVTCNMHPAEVMGKRSSPCGRTDKAVHVEDHGNGFMFVGCSDIEQAKRIVVQYTDEPDKYIWAAHTLHREGKVLNCAVWLGDGPGAHWDGATDYAGNPLPR